MIKRIMTTRAAVLALAAPLLLTAPALADKGHSKGKRTSATISIGNGHSGFTISTSNRGFNSHNNRGYRSNGYRLNEWGQTRREVKQMKRYAAQQCRRAIKGEAYNIGFRDVDFDDGRRVRQIGPRGFRVTFNEVEFETRRRDIDRTVTCTVRRGQVRRVEGIPQRGQRGHRRHTNYRY